MGPGVNGPATQAPGLGNASVFDLLTNEQTLLIVVDGEWNPNGYYGYTVALDNDTALLGVYREGFVGRAFVFVCSGSVSTQQAMLDPDLQEIVPRVELDADTAVVGCPSWSGGTI